MKNNVISNTKLPSQDKSKNEKKKTSYDDFWDWFTNVYSWVIWATCNIASAAATATLAWATKISKRWWNKNKEIQDAKQKLISHRLRQSKESFVEAAVNLWDVALWVIKATKWALGIVLSEGKNTYNRLRGKKETTSKKETNSKKKLDTKGKTKK